MTKLDVDDVIEIVCNNEMDESDDTDDEFDGYLECEEIEKLLGECKTDESDDEECVPIECDVNECVNKMEFVRHELDKMDVDGCDEVECKVHIGKSVTLRWTLFELDPMSLFLL